MFDFIELCKFYNVILKDTPILPQKQVHLIQGVALVEVNALPFSQKDSNGIFPSF